MAKRRVKTKMETREFLAIVAETGEHILLDEEIVRKYRLRPGIVSPFSSQPIVSVTRRVPVVVAPKPKRPKGRTTRKRKVATKKKPHTRKRTVSGKKTASRKKAISRKKSSSRRPAKRSSTRAVSKKKKKKTGRKRR